MQLPYGTPVLLGTPASLLGLAHCSNYARPSRTSPERPCASELIILFSNTHGRLRTFEIQLASSHYSSFCASIQSIDPRGWAVPASGSAEEALTSDRDQIPSDASTCARACPLLLHGHGILCRHIRSLLLLEHCLSVDVLSCLSLFFLPVFDMILLLVPV